MHEFIQKLIFGENIQAQKRRKIARTNAYLYNKRRVYRPNLPVGFKSRNTSAYYLTTHHKY